MSLIQRGRKSNADSQSKQVRGGKEAAMKTVQLVRQRAAAAADKVIAMNLNRQSI
jgi:hypothetical protein